MVDLQSYNPTWPPGNSNDNHYLLSLVSVFVHFDDIRPSRQWRPGINSMAVREAAMPREVFQIGEAVPGNATALAPL